MHDFLKGPDLYQRALPVIPIRRWAVEKLAFDVDKVIDYRRELNKRVGGNYLFLKFLQSLNVDITLPDDDYVWAVSDISLRLANSFHLTSAWGHGRPFNPGIIYGPEVTEVLLATIDDFDVDEAASRWRDLQPIKVMNHPYSGFSLPYLDGTATKARGGLTGGGWAMLTINLPMLALQHKKWWEVYVQPYPDSHPGMTQFFNAYPLANLLRSHFDVTLANRLMSIDLEKPYPEQDDPNPFYMNFYEGPTDRLLTHALKYIDGRRLSFDDWLSAIPQVNVDDFHQNLGLPDLAFSTQTEWAIFIGRLGVLRWLLAHNAKTESAYNNQYIVQIRHWMQHLDHGRYLQQGLRGEQLDQIQAIIDTDIMPYL